jgi:hypothetical protein
MSSRTNNGELIRDLCGIARRQDDSGLRVDEVPAQSTAKKSLWKERAVAEARLGIDFLLKLRLAVLAAELAVEGLLLLRFWCKLVLVSFDESPRNLRIHFFERTHGVTIAG